MGGDPVRTITALVVLIVLGGGVVYGYGAWKKSKAAAVGAACEPRFGCVEGADCMGKGIMPSYGTCFKRCAGDAECGAGQTCTDAHCVDTAAPNAVCAGNVACSGGSQCVTLSGRSAMCLLPCKTDFGGSLGEPASNECPNGTTCTRVLSAYTTNPMMGSDYCVPSF